MKTVMAKSSEEMSSKRQFHWTNKVTTNEDEEPPALKPSANTPPENEKQPTSEPAAAATSSAAAASTQRKKLQAIAVSRLRSVVLAVLNKHRSNSPQSLGHRVIGTLFGNRRGHVQFAFQRDPNSQPAFLVELATPISGLVKEMASGLVRIALECDRELEDQEKKKGGGGGLCKRLLEEPLWRTYCNGKKCGFATRRECGEKDWKVLKAVEPISMGAGVLPAGNGDDHNKSDGGGGGEEEVMYMRAKFERVVGSRDSEAFYMMNPDSNGAPELSIYLLRV